MDIRFRAKKILGAMVSFSELSEYSMLPEILNQQWSKSCIGFYQNFSGSFNEAIFVNEDGIVIFEDGKFRKIKYSDIAHTSCPPKEDEPIIVVMMKNFEKINLPVRNGRGDCKDVYEFVRFLDRAVAAQ